VESSGLSSPPAPTLTHTTQAAHKHPRKINNDNKAIQQATNSTPKQAILLSSTILNQS